mmetsp:Transcript_8664/g.28896  ORF Transcript_8664/g.28896 Transcript_8664/m.28896 type:complete len:81 (+) Transcript_8664:1280-1522(+)
MATNEEQEWSKTVKALIHAHGMTMHAATRKKTGVDSCSNLMHTPERVHFVGAKLLHVVNDFYVSPSNIFYIVRMTVKVKD